MTNSRIAFTAEYWNNQGVVCRAVEDRVGTSVMREFGLFDTWTEANAFATKLNEGLGLGQDEAREIVTGAQMAISEQLCSAVRQSSFWDRAPVIAKANSLQVRFLFANLELARTFCHLMRCGEADSKSDRLIEAAENALDLTLAYLPQLRLSKAEMKQMYVQVEWLKNGLKNLSCPVGEE